MANLLTTQEMADILRVNVKTFRGYVNKFKLPFYGSRSNKRFKESEVLELLRGRGGTLQVKTELKAVPAPSRSQDKYRKLLEN